MQRRAATKRFPPLELNFATGLAFTGRNQRRADRRALPPPGVVGNSQVSGRFDAN
jgi:hypothetical protein